MTLPPLPRICGKPMYCECCHQETIRVRLAQRWCKSCRPAATKASDLAKHLARKQETFAPVNAGMGVQPLREKLSTSARLQRNIDRIVRAARLPGYDELEPEKYIKILEAMA